MIKVLAAASLLALGACSSNPAISVTKDGLLTGMMLVTMGPPGEAIAAIEAGRPSIWSKAVLDPLAAAFCANPRDAKTGDCE